MNQPQEKERARYRYVHDYGPRIRSWYICYSPDRRSVLGKTVPKAVGLSRTQDTGHSFSQYGPTLAGEQHFYSFLKPNKWLRKEPDPLWVGWMGRILPALGTNQIAGFVEYHLLMHWEKIELDICQVIIIFFFIFYFCICFLCNETWSVSIKAQENIQPLWQHKHDKWNNYFMTRGSSKGIELYREM